MDLGSLELQIFVSLTVVLGGAFVALVCDYLKGNNEQLREHNIELRVRKEEQERRLLLDPAGFLGQWLPGQRQVQVRASVQAEPAAAPRAAAPHEAMQSFATTEALAQADERAAKLHARSGEESFDTAAVPPMNQRRNGRSRSNRKSARQTRKDPENYADWVRPEVIARVARRAEATVAYSSDIREDLEALPEDALPEPLNAAENWDIRQQLPSNDRTKRELPRRNSARKENAPATDPIQTSAIAVVAEPVELQETVTAAAQIPMEQTQAEQLAPEQAAILQKEIERVAQLERRPIAAAPGTILRPLTVPSLKLEEELQRVAEIAPSTTPAPFSWNSALLDEVIAASGTREVNPQAMVSQKTEARANFPAPLLLTAAPETAAVLSVADSELQEQVDPVEGEVPVAVDTTEPTCAVEEQVAGEIALDHEGFLEPAASSPVTGASLGTDQPEVVIPEAAIVESSELEPESLSLAVEAPADATKADAVPAAITVDTQSFLMELDQHLEPEAVAETVEVRAVEIETAADTPADAVEPEAVPAEAAVEPLPFLIEVETPSVQEAVEVEPAPETLAELVEPEAVAETVDVEAVEMEDAPESPAGEVETEAVPVEAAVEPPPFLIELDTQLVPEAAAETLEVGAVEIEAASEDPADAVEPEAVPAEAAVEPPPILIELDNQVAPAAVAETVEAEAVEIEAAPETPADPVEVEVVPAEATVEPPPFLIELETHLESEAVAETTEIIESETEHEVLAEVAETKVAPVEAASEPPPFLFELDNQLEPEAVADTAELEAGEIEATTETPADPIEAELVPAEVTVEPPPFLIELETYLDSKADAETAEVVESETEHEVVAEAVETEAVPVEAALEPPPFFFELDNQLEPEAVAETAELEAGEIKATTETPADTVESEVVLAEATVEPPPFLTELEAHLESKAVAETVKVVESETEQEVVAEAVETEAVPVEAALEPPPFLFELDNQLEPEAVAETAELEAVEIEATTETLADTVEAEVVIAEATVEPPPFLTELETHLESEAVAETAEVVEFGTAHEAPAETTEPDAVPVEAAEFIDCYSFWPTKSPLSGMGISPSVDYLQNVPGAETPLVRLLLVAEPALSPIESELKVERSEDSDALPELLPAYSDLSLGDSDTPVPVKPEVASVIPEPPPLWETEIEAQADQIPAPPLTPPIDISAIRQPEPEVVASAPSAIPDLLLPTGMHDISTWTRLMSLPNPMTGIIIVISLQPGEPRSTTSQPKGTQAMENNSPAIDKFMASFVREGDFGSHISENEWVFIYSNDVAGFNQRRVGMISEKLWDFQLRHLGLANVSFKWGAIDVKSEPLPAALETARDRMNQTRRSRKLPGMDNVVARRVVNG